MPDKRPLTEQERDFNRAEREDRQFADDMAELLRFKPFQAYQVHLNRRIEALGASLLDLLDEHPNAAARQEYNKGTLKGFVLARDIPSVTVQSMTGPPTESEDTTDVQE